VSQYTDILWVEVSRHGERASKKVYPWAADPNDNFEVPYELSYTGAAHHYQNGETLMNIFKRGGLGLSDEYNPDEVYVQTTYKKRTILSA
jgi:hypothetical protein